MQKDVKNVPQLRFSEFNDDWITSRLKKITSYVDYRGRAPKKSESGHFLVTAKNIKQGFIDYECSKEYVAEEDYLDVMSKGIPVKGDILFTTEAPMGNVAQVDNPNIALAQRVIKFRGNENLKNSYLLYYMLSKPFKKYTSKKAIGSTVKGISGKELHKTPISFPLLKEQQKIASFLSSVDTKLNLLQQKKDRLEHYKKGVMQQLFSQQLWFKDTDGNEFPKWEEKRLGDIGETINGLTYSPKDIDEKGILVLRSSNVQNRTLTFNDNVYVNVDDGNFNPVKENDILICVRNGSKRLIGKNAIIDKKTEGVAFGAFMAIYRSKYNSFLFHLFDTDYYNKQVYVNLGATINSINGSDLKKFKVPFPSLKEQTKIATFLSAIDNKIALVATQIENTQQFKKGLLQQMFV